MKEKKTTHCTRCGRLIRDRLYTDRDLSQPVVKYVDPPHPIGPMCAQMWRRDGAVITDKSGNKVK